MKRILRVAAVAMLAAATATQAATKTLNLFIWSEYIDPEIVADFEKAFECKVTMDVYEDNEGMIAKLEAGGVSQYDVVVPSGYVVQAMTNRNLLAPLRRENLPNFKNIDPRFMKLNFDAGNAYTVPYQWGTSGLYCRQAEGKPLERTWGLVFDPAKQPGPFLLVDSMRDCIGAALKYKGYSMNSVDVTQLKEARDLLLDAKKRSLGFEGGVGGKNKVLAKGCVMAQVYNGDAVRGMDEDGETVYFVPREGGEAWIDTMAIPAKAPHRDLAEAFINFILDPKVGAKLSDFNQYATPNKAAMEFVNPDDLKNPAIYPPEETLLKLEFLEDLGKNSRLYDEIWTQIKAK